MSSCSKTSCSAYEQLPTIHLEYHRLRFIAGFCQLGSLLILLSFFVLTTSAAESVFLGRDSCSSSGCHGGAGARQNQVLVWSRQDAHSRASATLTSARSRRIAQVLKIPDATRDRSCTSCHSPWQGLPSELFSTAGKSVNPHSEAVSCESCHGPAQEWIRSHTRPDLTRLQKGLDGLRDLTVFYNRANACVACHQVLDAKLITAGHPELIFELDGQTSAMPRHWIEQDEQYRVKGWLTGQAVALREVTSQILEQKKGGGIASHSFIQWQSLLWLISAALPEQKIAGFTTNTVESADRLSELHKLTDTLALETSVRASKDSLATMRQLSQTAGSFKDSGKGDPIFAVRAERLVLALDRLRYTFSPELGKKCEPHLEKLFALVQSRPDFDGAKFASELEALSGTLNKAP
ncbi:MAG TPA: multiheme c-type cytochrome [Candidatus Kapabacteria bacterium]|nr:multiheme c-type cytochrome [Candidatus Kapabacteria bacterium]